MMVTLFSCVLIRISSLRISAFLCASAVKCADNLFTAEAQRNAEIRRENRHHPSALWLSVYFNFVTNRDWMRRANLVISAPSPTEVPQYRQIDPLFWSSDYDYSFRTAHDACAQ